MLIGPVDQVTWSNGKPIDFSWSLLENALTYRLEVEDLQSTPVISAILPKGTGAYSAPPWLRERVGAKVVRWRVVAFDEDGKRLSETEWRTLRFGS